MIKNDRVDRVVAAYATADTLGLAEADVIDLSDRFVLPGLVPVTSDGSKSGVNWTREKSA